MKMPIFAVILGGLLLPCVAQAQENAANCERLRRNIEFAGSSGVDQSALASARNTYNSLCRDGPTSKSRRSVDDEEYERALREANKPIDESYVAYSQSSGERITCDAEKNWAFCCSKEWNAFDESIQTFENTAQSWLKALRNTKTEEKLSVGRIIWDSRNRAAYERREKMRVCSQSRNGNQVATPKMENPVSSDSVANSSLDRKISSRKPHYVSCVKPLAGFKAEYGVTSKRVLERGVWRFRNDCNEYALSVVCVKRHPDFSNSEFRYSCAHINLKHGDIGSATLEYPSHENQGDKPQVRFIWRSCLGSDMSCPTGLSLFASAMQRSETGNVD